MSDTVVAHAGELSAKLISERGLDASTLVLEVASNDGYLLRHYQRRGIPVLGVDPARNVAEVARARGVPTIAAFFDRELASRLRDEGHRPAVIHANNVLAHVPDLGGFVAGIATLLADDGIAVIELPYLGDLLSAVEFDTIYHEHLFYFSLTALTAVLARQGLRVADVQRLEIHGGSLRLHVGHADACVESEAVAALLDAEQAWVWDLDHYLAFAERVGELGRELRALLDDLRAQGRRIAAYGASAKGSTLLNVLAIGRERIEFVVDRSEVKQGFYTPGAHLEISPPARLLEDMPDYTLLLTWNFAEEILAQQREYVARGGRFIVPVPSPRIVP